LAKIVSFATREAEEVNWAHCYLKKTGRWILRKCLEVSCQITTVSKIELPEDYVQGNCVIKADFRELSLEETCKRDWRSG
jgi:hypothetical protein